MFLFMWRLADCSSYVLTAAQGLYTHQHKRKCAGTREVEYIYMWRGVPARVSTRWDRRELFRAEREGFPRRLTMLFAIQIINTLFLFSLIFLPSPLKLRHRFRFLKDPPFPPFLLIKTLFNSYVIYSYLYGIGCVILKKLLFVLFVKHISSWLKLLTRRVRKKENRRRILELRA